MLLLGENRIFSIPPHIGKMSSLKELYINDNADLQVSPTIFFKFLQKNIFSRIYPWSCRIVNRFKYCQSRGVPWATYHQIFNTARHMSFTISVYAPIRFEINRSTFELSFLLLLKVHIKHIHFITLKKLKKEKLAVIPHV